MRSKLPEGWEEVELGEVIEVQSGYGFKSKDFSNEGIPVIKIKNIMPPYIDLSDTDFISEKILEGKENYLTQYNDILISQTGSTINQINSVVGKVGRVKYRSKSLINQRVARLCSKSNKVLDNDFLYHTVSTNDFKLNLALKASGSANQANISATQIKNTPINLPPLPEQKVIADTLSALDDKIELNNKINENLEKQAQEIFKHWFVDFEFPDEEGKPYKSSGGEMIESVLGLIPKGWEVDSMGRSSLGYLAKSGIQAFKGEKIYLATADVSNTNIVNNKTYISMNDKPSRANMQPTANTVWFAKMKDSRKLLLVDEIDEILKNNYIFSTGFAGIQCTETSVYYLWTYIQSESFDTIKNSLATGTTMQSINNRNINNIYIPIPNKKLMNNFNLLVSQLFKYIVKNRQQNLYLSELRDTLLPKLMSGEIRIPFENEEGSI